MQRLTLLELNALVRQTLELTMPDEYWVEAELAEAREWNGHCYMELIQKEERSNTPVARASAKCWRSSWALIRPAFERTTGQKLHAGMKVLMKVFAQFHESYGFSWIVTDIDATYTMGDMARRRQEIINQLKAEGVFDLQRDLHLPMFCQRIAVISSASAAGYGDFCRQLQDNDYGFAFQAELFAAVMQGEQVEQSVINALNQIFDRRDDFDCVVIIRGGGSTSDLSGFDTLALAENVANFPLPIVTGIGHERDESVIDMVAHTRVKTPTAAAAFLVGHLAEVDGRISDAQEAIVNMVKRRLTVEKMRLEHWAEHIPVLFSVVRTRQEARLDALFRQATTAARQRMSSQAAFLEMKSLRLKTLIERKVDNESHRLQLLAQRMEAQNPERMLRRGYSITKYNGRALKDVSTLKQGAEIETRLANGTVVSVVAQCSSTPNTFSTKKTS